jgi:hypothetical protein
VVHLHTCERRDAGDDVFEKSCALFHSVSTTPISASTVVTALLYSAKRSPQPFTQAVPHPNCDRSSCGSIAVISIVSCRWVYENYTRGIYAQARTLQFSTGMFRLCTLQY